MEKKEKPFIHLHLHTEFSLLDGASRVAKGYDSPLLEACKKKNMPAVAITDHGNMYGVYTFYKMAKKAGIKPIIGCEFYVCEDMHDKSARSEFNHLVLIAKNNQGYRNLVKLDSLAFTEGFFYKPRIDLKLLKEHSDGLICLSACLAGKVPRLLLQGAYQEAVEHAKMMQAMFAPGDYYIELQDHGIEEQKRSNPLLVKLAREIGAKTVATNDVHYLEKEDAEMHDVLLCIQTGKTVDDANRMRFEGDAFYLKTYSEMEEVLGWCPEALETPFEIADKCDVTIERHDLLPPYKPEDGSRPEEYIRKIAYEGVARRYPAITDEIRARMEYELDIIIKMGFAEYYLIVWDFIAYAKKNNIPVGAGRGSGVGSLVAYSMGITNVDPLRYNLLFERFLNPERVSAPDFDVDFCFEGRGQVKDYVVEKYGQDKVCEIITFGTLATKAAIKDVARVYNMPFDTVNKITKLIPMGKISIDDVLGFNGTGKMVPEVVDLYKNDDSVKKILDMARMLEGMPRNCSKHAAGVVICKEVISDFVPLQVNGEDVTTQFTKDEVEELGMLKMDFLGLKTLTDINKAKQYVEETTGVVIDFGQLGYEDPEVYKLIASGDTDAVFQLESPGMKRFMRELIPENMEDVIAGISLYRPGPMDSIPRYVESKHNPKKITYYHPSLEPILKMTYGCIVYQEQVMEIVRELAGYTFGRADILRRAMGKKKKEVMQKERDIFINGCPESENTTAVVGAVNKGVPKETAEIIFNDMESFASYAFNKSHAAAYAVIAYETAFLKRYYPLQFVTAVINNRITNADEIAKYVTYLVDSGYSVLQPDINKSKVYFSVEGDAVRFGLMGIKNVGEAAIFSVIEEREKNGPYKDLYDVIRRSPVSINKRMLESMILGGAFDSFGETRATHLAAYEGMLQQCAQIKKAGDSGQLSIFDVFADDCDDTYTLTPVKEIPKNELLIQEKLMLNVYMTGHPLDEYREQLKDMDFDLKQIQVLLHELGDDQEEMDRDEIEKQYHERKVVLGGMIGDVRKKVTKNGQTMAIGRLEDLYDSIDIVLFPRMYEKYKNKLEKDAIVLIGGILQTMGKVQITVDRVEFWDGNDQKPKAETLVAADLDVPQKKVYVKLDDDAQLNGLLSIVSAYAGDAPVFCKKGGVLYDTGGRINPNNGAILEMKALVGEENIFIK